MPARTTTPRPIPNRPFEVLVALLALDPIWPMPGWEATDPDGVWLPPTGPLGGRPAAPDLNAPDPEPRELVAA